MSSLCMCVSSVIRVKVREVRNRGLEPTAIVDVKEVFKSSLVNIPKETQTLYYTSSCLCPPLSTGEEYLIMGYENEETSRYEQNVMRIFIGTTWKSSRKIVQLVCIHFELVYHLLFMERLGNY